MSNELPDQLMDVKEAAAIIGVTVGRVRQLASAGKLKGERLGGPERGLWVFQRADVVAYAARPSRAGRPRKAAPTDEKDTAIENGKEIKSKSERMSWAGRMFVPSPQYDGTIASFKQIETIFWWFDMFGTWTLIEKADLDLSYADAYRQYVGEWNHVGKRHTELGMAWAAWALGIAEMDIYLTDSPDIRGTWTVPHGKMNILGDIGRCTFSAWLNGVHELRKPGDLWISVLDENTQVIIEMKGYLSKAMSSLMAKRLGLQS